MLGRVLFALALAAAAIAGGAIAVARTDFVSNNLCAYAVATIEEASSAHVRLARCSWASRARARTSSRSSGNSTSDW